MVAKNGPENAKGGLALNVDDTTVQFVVGVSFIEFTKVSAEVGVDPLQGHVEKRVAVGLDLEDFVALRLHAGENSRVEGIRGGVSLCEGGKFGEDAVGGIDDSRLCCFFAWVGA